MGCDMSPSEKDDLNWVTNVVRADRTPPPVPPAAPMAITADARAAEVAEWLDYRGLPPTASLKELIEQERVTAALAAVFDEMTRANVAEYERGVAAGRKQAAADKVWILAHVKDAKTGDWELGGVFSTRELAIAACVHPYDGIWEETLDRAYPRDETEYVPTFYPLRGIVGTGPGQPVIAEEPNHAD